MMIKIRTLKDFVAVPADELYACLRAFRASIERIKAASTIAVSNGVSTDCIQFDEFIWESRCSKKDSTVAVHKTTPVEELPLRPSTKRQLQAKNIYCLEDLSEISVHELWRMPDVGRTTIEDLREILYGIGMTFKPNPNPMGALYEQSKVARKIKIEQRAQSLTDASHISDLGLAQATLWRAMKHGHETVGSLRGLSVQEYAIKFGRSQAKEIINLLKMLGRPIHGMPTPLDLWRHGLLKKNEISEKYGEDSPIANLAPWIGWNVTAALERHGAATIGDAVSLVRAGNLTKVKGIGASSAQKIATVLKQRGFLQGDQTGLSFR